MINELFFHAQQLNIDDKSIVFLATSLMDRYFSQTQLSSTLQDSLLTAYTCLFIASKNSDVEPMSLKFFKNVFNLNFKYSHEEILNKEFEIRKATNYDNQFSTLFDFLLLYIRIWKAGCQKIISKKSQWYTSTHKFLCEVELTAYFFVKSLLIDANSVKKFKGSISVAAIISASIELILRIKLQ